MLTDSPKPLNQSQKCSNRDINLNQYLDLPNTAIVLYVHIILSHNMITSQTEQTRKPHTNICNVYNHLTQSLTVSNATV